VSASSPITIQSQELRQAVENHLDTWIPYNLWSRAEHYERLKLDQYRLRWPEIDHYDNDYLVLLTADTVREMAFSDYTIALSAAIMADRAETKGAKQ
jgi:hypothetical protein